jgi:hypothetical protein
MLQMCRCYMNKLQLSHAKLQLSICRTCTRCARTWWKEWKINQINQAWSRNTCISVSLSLSLSYCLALHLTFLLSQKLVFFEYVEKLKYNNLYFSLLNNIFLLWLLVPFILEQVLIFFCTQLTRVTNMRIRHNFPTILESGKVSERESLMSNWIVITFWWQAFLP